MCRRTSTSRTVAALVLLGALTGSGPSYLAERGRDAADVFTASVGLGFGAKARVGPVQVGLLLREKCYGVRSGVVFRNEDIAVFEIVWRQRPEMW
jgi:hypothetical protein